MKKLILILVIVVSSCSNEIEKKDLQGNWHWYYQENDKTNLAEIIIKNDSITLIDFFIYSKKGIYNLKKDSIIISLKDETIIRKISLNDSSLIFNSSNFQKSEYYNSEKYDEIELINIISENKINANEIYKYQGNFILLKHNDSVKIKFENRYTEFSEYIYSLGLHKEKWGHIVFLGQNLNLRELKNVYLEMNYYNIASVIFVTKTNFKNNNYDVFYTRTNIWQNEINQYIKENRLEIKQFPFSKEFYSKENYIKINKPILIEIKSDKDFLKLDNMKLNSTYLVSFGTSLSVKEYLLLNQKINKIRKEQNLKISTEIIDFK